jgi:CSLREA domain-containing protein
MKEHVTMVASKLGCIRDAERRNASELRMYYGNSGGRAERLAWLASRDVSLVNDSEGGANEPEINWSIRNDMITITHSASNSQSEPVGCHDNAICTGSYSIGSTANIDWWKTDPANREGRYGLSGSTSFIDPPGRWDAEKPDVLGNGEATLTSQVVTPARAEWVSAYGTSFAAPNVGGLVALLQEDLPLTTVWPELVRPMVMTAALRHNVLGVSLSRNGAPDERDGAGVPTATTLRQLVAQGTYMTMMLDPSMFDGSNRYLPPGASFTLQPGETARAVLGWMYCSEAGTNRLSADLDLQLVERSSGTVVDWSTSYTNSLEMIQYTNRGSQPQTYDLRLTHAGFSTCEGVLREYAGLAWAVTGLDLGPSRSLQVTKTADTMDYSCDTDCSLREAIRAANAYPGLDRISVPDGEYQLALGGPAEDLCLTGDLDILDDLELVGTGQGVVVRGDGSDRVFEIRNGARVLISSLTVRDGSSPSATGGGIAVSDGSLELSDAVVEFNNADRGGGIWNNGGKLVLRRSRVYGNVAGTYGGGIFTEGGSFDAFESSIEGNRANDSGGGIYNSIGFSWLRNSTIASNECEKGGGIRNFDDLQLDDCTVSQNYARLEGGGIWSANGSTAAINYTTLNRNRSGSGSALWTQGVFGLNGSLIDGTCVRFGRVPDYDDENIESPGDTCGLRAGHGITNVPDLMLGNLLPHGGVTKVCPPRPRSPALDPYFLYHPYPGNCPATDQRGAARPTDADGDGNARCESGSVEWVVSELKFTSKSKLEWLAVPGSQRYNTYRGLLSVLRSTGGAGSPDYGSCVNHLDPNLTDAAFTDATVPPAGDGYFYLRSATTPIGETPLGWDDDGHERWPAIPCPP